MFFRLPKNTIKNLHFGPFGGGVPPLPPPPPQYSLCLRFYKKIIIFHKKTFKPFYLFLLGGGGTSCKSVLRRTLALPPRKIIQKHKLYDIMQRIVCIISYSLWFVVLDDLSGER